MSTLSIGALAQRCDTKVETVRYSERIGLMPAPARTSGGHRVYDEARLKQLYLIRRARELGFPIGCIQ